MRWNPSALLWLQEITEDFLIEFFEDAYYLATHTHRVTIISRDCDTLRRLWFHYATMLLPDSINNDPRMRTILTVSPLHPRSR